MFVAPMVGLNALLVFAGGFIAFHFDQKFPSTPLKIAAWLLVIGGGISLLWHLYVGVQYWGGTYGRLTTTPTP